MAENIKPKRGKKGETPEQTIKRKTDTCRQVFQLMRESANSSSTACKELGVAHSTMNRWMEELGLMEEYAHARDDMIERIASDMLKIADCPVAPTPQGTTDNGAVQKQRLQVDTRKWLLSKIASKKYGDKLDHTSSDGSMSPIAGVTGFTLVPMAPSDETEH
jgi:hypothetical protein